MENKSRLPKATGLRPPFMTKGSDKIPITSSAVKPLSSEVSSTFRLKRRSKSVTDLRSLRTQFIPKITELKKIPEAVIQKKPLRTANSANPVASQRTTTKRPATKAEDDVKPKVARQKIPDWDYKTRFNVLNDKHKTLRETYESMKTNLEDFEIVQENLTKANSENQALHIKVISFEQHNAELKKKTSEQENTIKELNEIKLLYEKLKVKNTENEKLLEIAAITETKYVTLISDNEKLTKEFDKLTADHKVCASLREQLNLKTARCSQLESENSKLQEDQYKYEINRRILHNTIQDLKGNIRVFCRIRPPLPNEDDFLQCSMDFCDERCLEIRKSKESISSTTNKSLETKADFSFDRVFQQNCSQKEIFDELSLLVQSALDGYNVCVFAYGQTGSGKTYTMQGLDTPEELGLIPRAVDLIFNNIEELKRTNWVYEVRASFLEIYNENIKDLLKPNATQNLDICFNEGKGTTVNSLTIKEVKSAECLKQLMRSALGNRKIAATNFNEMSSRSHAVSQIYLEGTNGPANVHCSASISLVDLAGSESAKNSSSERINETKHINKSLSALGNVMLALHNKRKHVPYRDSKLTYLLQSSLGGNSKTLMIVNISPFEHNYGESISTLRFASKVKEVTTASKKNKTNL